MNQILTIGETTKELSPYHIHKQLIEVIRFSKQGFLAIGKLLKELREEDNFQQAVGEGIDTWDDYLAQPEIGLSRGEANRLIQIYEQFVLRFGFDEEYVSSVPIKNLHYLLPVAKKMDESDNIDELMESARHLSQKDFKERIYEEKTDEGEETYTYDYLVMKRRQETGQLSRVHGISHEDIIEAFDLKDNQ